MHRLEQSVRDLGTVATRRELIAAGYTGRQLTYAVHIGILLRVRKGWYATPDADPALLTAIRVGGRLGCISAAEVYGWATAEHHTVHVSLAENASRLRHSQSNAVHPPAADIPGVVLHWHSPVQRPLRQRLLTSPYETTLQIAGCQSPEFAVAAFDSFVHMDPVSSADLEEWLSDVAPRFLAELPRREAGCHSFLESIGRIRLEACGIRGEYQVRIDGVGRVDLVIDGWLVIEWDGREFHDGADAFEQDRWRDAMLTARGYRVLRFSYRMVMFDWYAVIDAIRSALATRV